MTLLIKGLAQLHHRSASKSEKFLRNDSRLHFFDIALGGCYQQSALISNTILKLFLIERFLVQ